MLFKNIIMPIPIDATADAEIAINRALEMGEPATVTTVHIIFICSNDLLDYFSDSKEDLPYTAPGKEDQLIQSVMPGIRSRIEQQRGRWIVFTEIFTAANITNALIQYNERNNIDLFIISIGKKQSLFAFFSGIDINKIARYSECAILAITSGCIDHPVKSILLPVSDYVPVRKIQMAVAFAHLHNGCIHLVTSLNGDDGKNSKTKIATFYETYKTLKECGYPPQYEILSGFDSQEVLLEYAHEVNADLILLSPQNDSFFRRCINAAFINFRHPLSPLQVMILQPTMKPLN
jgi:hypothetical protein